MLQEIRNNGIYKTLNSINCIFNGLTEIITLVIRNSRIFMIHQQQKPFRFSSGMGLNLTHKSDVMFPHRPVVGLYGIFIKNVHGIAVNPHNTTFVI